MPYRWLNICFEVMRCLVTLLCIFCRLVIALDDPCGRNASIDIHIIGFFPCTDPNDARGIPVDNCDGIERIPIMRLALEEINGRCDLLPGYRLVVDYANSACSSIPATYNLIQQTDPSQPTKLMILGTACSGASHLMGVIAERMLNIPQVAYTASDSVFGLDKERYPRFYRMVPITAQLVDGYVALVKELNWNRVALISYDDDFNIDAANSTRKRLHERNVRLVVDESLNEDHSIVLNQVKSFNARIIIAWIPHNIAAKFWCSVIKHRLAGPDFVWFFPGWFKANWWAAVDGTDCTAEEMSKALEHSLGGLGNSVDDNNNSRILVSNKSVEQFTEDLNAKSALGTVKTDIFLNYGYVYDAAWTIALALNSSISILEERGLGRLEDFTYDSVEMADVFTEAIANVSFEGISGNISLKPNGDRNHPLVQIRQYRDGEAVPVLVYDPSSNSNNKFYEISNQTLMWQGNTLPRDAPVPVTLTSGLAECIIAGVVSSIGILSSIFFFVFNLYYCKHPVVKRSSYRLNSLILVGVFVGFVGTLLHVIKLDSDMSETFTTTVCNARVWTNELAFVVAFGTMFAKVWRLYKVFFNKRMVKRKYLHDRHLFMMVAVIVAPTLVILIVQVATFPLTLHTVTTVNEDDFSTEEVYSECRGRHKFVFSSLSYAENAILAVVSVLVAFETQRHVPKLQERTTSSVQVPTLYKYHESAVINLTTILTILLSSACQAVLIIFRLNRVQEGVLLVVTLRDCLWMYPMIYLLFIPKIYKVYYGKFTDKKMASQYFSAQSNPFYSTRASMSSVIAGRRGSSASVLSERQTSYQYGRRCSDFSGGLDRDGAITNNHNLAKKVHFRTPTHEHNSEMLAHNAMSHVDSSPTQLRRSATVGMDILDNNLKTLNSELLSVLYMELLEEPKSSSRPPNMFRYKTTEV